MSKYWKDQNPPTDTSYIWIRLNNNGAIVGYFKYENDQWTITERPSKNSCNGDKCGANDAINTIVGTASENMDTLGEVEQSFLGLATVATTGDYNDLLNKPNQRTFKEFNANWPTATTLEAFGAAVLNDSSAVVGNAYLGGLSCTGLPSGMMQGDVTVEIIGTNSNKVARFTLTSTNVYPYHWEGCYWQGHFRGWKSFALTTKGSTSERPSLLSEDVGYMYYDTTLNKPIWFNGTDWVDATGTTV